MCILVGMTATQLDFTLSHTAHTLAARVYIDGSLGDLHLTVWTASSLGLGFIRSKFLVGKCGKVWDSEITSTDRIN